jgi:DnaJ-class molecular chaperone
MAGLGPGSGGPGGMGDAADLFAQFFGGGATFFDFGGGGGARRHKGQDTEVPYDVTLEDLYNGKSVKMNMEREIICGTCQGYVIRAGSRSPVNQGSINLVLEPGVARNPRIASTAKEKAGLLSKHRYDALLLFELSIAHLF